MRPIKLHSRPDQIFMSELTSSNKYPHEGLPINMQNLPGNYTNQLESFPEAKSTIQEINILTAHQAGKVSVESQKIKGVD
jgi:hypothetical protein